MADSVTYYPSCVVNLRIRFDEAVIPTSTPLNVTNSKGEVVPSANVSSGPAGLNITQNANREGSHIAFRIPKTCSVELPAYRQAGKFRMTFDYQDLPIDPRLVRATAVEIYMDSLPADDYANGILQVTPPGSNAGAPPVSNTRLRSSVMMRKGALAKLQESADNLAMMGTVDSWHVEHTDKGSVVTIEGRDYVGIMLDKPATVANIEEIKLNRPIDAVIRDLIAQASGWLAGMQVLASPASEWPNNKVPTVGLAITEQILAPRVRRAVTTGAVRLSMGADPDRMNFWDVITRWCFYVGAVPTFTVRPDANRPLAPGYERAPVGPPKVTLLIRPAPQLYAQLGSADSSRFGDLPTPFLNQQPRTVGDKQLRIRRMLFGRNISELNYERKFAGVNIPKLVMAASYNPSSDKRGADKLIEVVYPQDRADAALAANANIAAQNAALRARNSGTTAQKASTSRVAPSGEISAQDILRIVVPGEISEDKLRDVARAVYEELGRGELGGSCHTKSLSSFGAGNEDPDLVRIRPGDAIQISIDAQAMQTKSPHPSPLNAQARKSAVELQAELAAKGMDQALAAAIAISLTNSSPQLMDVYRVSNVRLDWNISNGIAVAFDFHNYVVPRNQLDNPKAPAASANTPGQAVVSAKGR